MQARSQVQVENDRVMVTQWRFGPGDETGPHVHAYDYVVVPLTSGVLRLENGIDSRDSQLETGESYAGCAGTTHNVVNINGYEFLFVEIELK